MRFSTPILFCIFNRPNPTSNVFDVIRRQRPKQLLIVQDGPRSDVPDDAEAVRRTRDVVRRVDWPCDVRTLFAPSNLGCKRRMSSGITWGFSQTERLIVLEDDCLPSDDFFPFCEELLERYADRPDVLMISGDNFQLQPRGEYDYYFSKYAHIWGWASWRRAWQNYDLSMTEWPSFRATRLNDVCPDANERTYWCEQLDRQFAGQIDSWDFPWMFCGWKRQSWTILPNVNLVSNIGFGEGATHTTQRTSPLANLPTGAIALRSHPSEIICDRSRRSMDMGKCVPSAGRTAGDSPATAHTHLEFTQPSSRLGSDAK